MKPWLEKLLRRKVTADKSETNTIADPPLAGERTQGYSSDQPILKKTDDRFHRWPFAKRIADTLATRIDSTSLVIGLFGPWGDGKTSTLHLMEEALAAYNNVVIVRFNPWHFQSEELLLRGFFATLAEALEKSLSTKAEELGKLLKRYGSVLSFASIPVGVTVPSGAVTGLGEALSTVELDELRRRVERVLESSGKRVVILIDDIDRLDRSETQTIFKLVKLSAGFNYTSYVLSFDDEMVAAAIGEKYAQGGVEAGRSFLEKIIQVPLHLPPPDEIALRTVTFEGIEAAITASRIKLSQEQFDIFAHRFVAGIEPRLHTPRHAKLYVNALMFALPLLKGEANPIDLMLVEGIRVFYPKLFIVIRDNPEYFLRGAGDGNHQQTAALKERIKSVIDDALNDTGVQDKDQVRHHLLEGLFPRLGDVFGNMNYGHDWENEWAREQRVCSGQYFKRYFTYGVPPGDVSDVEVRTLVEQLAGVAPARLNEVIKQFADRGGIPQLIRKLRALENTLDAKAAHQLALGIARNGSVIPRERGMLISDDTLRQAAILVAHLLLRIPTGNEREVVAREIFRDVQPLNFGFTCFQWVRHEPNEPEEKRIISEPAENEVATALTERVRVSAVQTPLYESYGQDAPALFWLWNKYGDAATLRQHLQHRFQTHPTEVDAFLDTYVGTAWTMNTGLPHRSDLDRSSYDGIAKVFDPDAIVTNLKERYGHELDAPRFHHGNEVPLARRIAHQFVFIHMQVQHEKAPAAAGPPPQ